MKKKDRLRARTLARIKQRKPVTRMGDVRRLLKDGRIVFQVTPLEIKVNKYESTH